MNEFEVFDVNPFVSRLLGMGDLSGLVDKLQEVVPKDQRPEIMEKLSQGNFTLRIMYDMFQNMLNMGPLKEVFSMLPGIGAKMMPKGHEKESEMKIKWYITMMDSMKANELDSASPKDFKESRIMQIARGSGRQVGELIEMLEEYKRLAKMWSKKKGPMMSFSRNMNPQNMSRVLLPQILEQMGGMAGLQNLMKHMKI